MGGNLLLDKSFQSGVEGCPGARFVVSLNQPPLEEDEDDLSRRSAGSVKSEPRLAESSPHLDEHNLSAKEPSLGSEKPSALPQDFSVLFVDDDSVIRWLFARAVAKVEPRWRIQQAASGEAGLQLCESEALASSFLIKVCTNSLPGRKRSAR